jgi:hypothetical protein
VAYSQFHFEKIIITKQQEYIKQLIKKKKLLMAKHVRLMKLIKSFQVVENKSWYRIQGFNLNSFIKTRLSKLDYTYLRYKVNKFQIFLKLILESVWNLILFTIKTQHEMIVIQKQKLNKYWNSTITKEKLKKFFRWEFYWEYIFSFTFYWIY